MATYVITDDLNSNTSNGQWGISRFKHRHKSNDGHPTAQQEFERRKRAGTPTVLWRWQNYQPVLVDKCNLPKGQ